MKKRYMILLLFIALAGCKRNELQYFEEEVPFLNIWLGTRGSVLDSITHNFAYSSGNKDSILFYYRIAGYPANQDRKFELSTSDNDAKLLNFSFGSYSVPAGKSEGNFVLYVDKPIDKNLFLNKDLKVTFQVKSTTVFQPAVKEQSSLRIIFKNAVTKPDNWENAALPYLPLRNFFGVYSNEKYKFVIQVTGMSNFAVYRTVAVNPELEPNTITEIHARALQSQCKIALEKYKADNGKDLLDENNIPIVFP
ncbi:DUF4843 domain-containing protein [Pedobacter africanus]|uniref:DUF4843 domain-containing protein n=1 Tax=Pedobacter africanus TaxID=151894 RepID=A0A1W1YS10_9SPHI|nr:DUF4843 domain-containing protein [Pedobacter africanus]SMC38611.1 protein of unknown function [Pedobacter africanus]